MNTRRVLGGTEGEHPRANSWSFSDKKKLPKNSQNELLEGSHKIVTKDFQKELLECSRRNSWRERCKSFWRNYNDDSGRTPAESLESIQNPYHG